VTLSRSASPAAHPSTPPSPARRAPRAADDTAADVPRASAGGAATDSSALETELSTLGIQPRFAGLSQRPTLAQAIRLAIDVTLVLDTAITPDTADLTALAEAARPLLDLLRHLGLSQSPSES
jgi:hypothetical protein